MDNLTSLLLVGGVTAESVFLTEVLKVCHAAGLPDTPATWAVFLATLLCGLYAKWRLAKRSRARMLYEVHEAVMLHLQQQQAREAAAQSPPANAPAP